MLISEIRPFVRYARTMTVTSDMRYPTFYPYDARLFYVKSGQGEIQVDGVMLNMSKGCAVVINAGVKYRLKTPEDSVTYIAVNFDFTSNHSNRQIPVAPAPKGEFDPSMIIEQVSFDDQTAFNRFLYVADVQKTEKSVGRIIGEYTKKLIGYDISCTSLLSGVLVEILRKSRAVSAYDGGVTQQILDFIHENYRLPITNKTVAEKFGFHPNYLSVLIKNSTGQPLHKYILQVRLLHAIELIETGLFSMNEVAERSGFCDVFYFSKYFKSTMGATPTDFARGIRK
jgi:AraC-like DNA-binding protein